MLLQQKEACDSMLEEKDKLITEFRQARILCSYLFLIADGRSILDGILVINNIQLKETKLNS